MVQDKRGNMKSHPTFWRVYEGDILRANQSTRAGAVQYMKPGRVLVPPKGADMVKGESIGQATKAV
jgi:hypothetical protein